MLGSVHTWCPGTSTRAPAQNGAVFRHTVPSLKICSHSINRAHAHYWNLEWDKELWVRKPNKTNSGKQSTQMTTRLWVVWVGTQKMKANLWSSDWLIPREEEIEKKENITNLRQPWTFLHEQSRSRQRMHNITVCHLRERWTNASLLYLS